MAVVVPNVCPREHLTGAGLIDRSYPCSRAQTITMKWSAMRRLTAPATAPSTPLRSHTSNRMQCVAWAQFAMYMQLTQISRRRASTTNLSTRRVPKMRTARSMSKVPVINYLHRPWAALRPSRYARQNWFNPSFEPPSCILGVQKVYIWWWWRRRRRLAVTTDQHGYGRGFQAL